MRSKFLITVALFALLIALMVPTTTIAKTSYEMTTAPALTTGIAGCEEVQVTMTAMTTAPNPFNLGNPFNITACQPSSTSTEDSNQMTTDVARSTRQNIVPMQRLQNRGINFRAGLSGSMVL